MKKCDTSTNRVDSATDRAESSTNRAESSTEHTESSTSHATSRTSDCAPSRAISHVHKRDTCREAKGHHPWGFYPMFVLSVAVVLVFSLVVGGMVIWALVRSGIYVPDKREPFPLFLVIMIPSVLIGLLFTGFFGRIAVKPLTKLSKGLTEVAAGNFSVRLKEDARGEFGRVNYNFNLMTRELENIEMLREDFIVNVSHEFKSPLSSIEGYATLLQDPTLSEAERQEYLDVIFGATRSLSNMSSNILSLSNLETQTAELSKEQYSLDEQVRQVIVMLEPVCAAKDIELDIEMDDIAIFANADLLETVWINLLGNAIKFTESGGRITITLHANDEQVLASFRDTGCGMSATEVSRIFDKFYQADSSHRSDGNGLGLSLARTIAHKHHGVIDVASELGEGSVFTVRLPL